MNLSEAIEHVFKRTAAGDLLWVKVGQDGWVGGQLSCAAWIDRGRDGKSRHPVVKLKPWTAGEKIVDWDIFLDCVLGVSWCDASDWEWLTVEVEED